MFTGKHTEAVKIWLTEQEFTDLSRLAACKDRKVSEIDVSGVGSAGHVRQVTVPGRGCPRFHPPSRGGELVRRPSLKGSPEISDGMTP